MEKDFWVLFKGSDSLGYEIKIPELDLVTECSKFSDIFDTAFDCICLTICSYEDEGMEVLLKPFKFDSIKPNQGSMLIRVNSELYRKRFLDKSKKVTLTIPTELYNRCKELGINKSKVLQNALTKMMDKKKITTEIIDNPFKQIGKQVAQELDNKILNDIAEVYQKYGFNLDKDLFMGIVKEYNKRIKERKECQNQDF